jgi:hypothetical protein
MAMFRQLTVADRPPRTSYKVSLRIADNQGVGRANRQFAVSNINMTKPNHWIVKASVFLFSSSLVCSQGTWGQAPVGSATTPELYFYALPSKQLFWRGETVVIELQLYSRSEQPLLVSRMLGDEFVSFKVIEPDGNEVQWQGETRAGFKEHSPSDFTVLGQYKQISANRIISLKDGAGFVFDKPGQYSLTAEFSMGPPGKFAPFEVQAKTPMGSFHVKVAFCIEACILEPLQVRSNARDQLLTLCACSTPTSPDTNSSAFLLDAQRRRSGRFSANDLLSSSTASKPMTKIITSAAARFFAPRHTSPQHLGWRKVCSLVPMTQQLHALSEFLAVERSETAASTF